MIEIATAPSTGSDGSFFTENVKAFDLLQPTQTSYVASDRLAPGTYWVHVKTVDNNCSYEENNTCFAWAPAIQLVVSLPPNRIPTLRWIKWTSDSNYNAEAVMRVCDETDGALTFRTTLTHRRGKRVVTQRRSYLATSPTPDGDWACDVYIVKIPVLRDVGLYTMRMTVTDARAGASKPFTKRFIVGD